MNIQRPSCALAVVLIATQVLGPAILWAADQRGIRVEENRRVLIAAVSGEQLMLQNGGDTKVLHFRDAVNPGDQISTGDRTVAEVLIGNRAVVTLGQGTTAQVTAVSETQTTVQVQKGSVRVAASAMALGGQGKITVQTPTGQVQTRGGIIRVMVDAPIGSAEQLPIGAAKPYRASYSPNTLVAAANTRGDIIQVEEGTAEIFGAGPGGGTLTVKSGQSATLQSGQVGSLSGLANQTGLRVGVLASAGHSKTPKEGLENLVALQINQATALGKALTGAAETGGEKSGKKDDTKNAINGATGGVNLIGIGTLRAPSTSGTITFNSSTVNLTGAALVLDSANTGGLRDPNTDVMSSTADPLSIGSPKFARLLVSGATNLTPDTRIGDPIGQSAVLAGFDQSGQVAVPSQTEFANKFGVLNDGNQSIPTYQLRARISNEFSSSDSPQIKDLTISNGVKYSAGTTVTTQPGNPQGVNLVSLIPSNTPWANNRANIPPISNININFSAGALAIEDSTVSLEKDPLRLDPDGSNPSGVLFHVKAPADLIDSERLTVNAQSSSTSLIQLTESINTSAGAVVIDKAILFASAPIVALYGTGPANNPVMSFMTTNGDFLKLLNGATADVQGDALVTLSASRLVVNGNLVTLSASDLTINGNLLNLNNGATATVNGYLFSLNNSSTQTLDSGSLFSLTGGSSLNLNGNAFGVFDGGVNTLSIDNNLCTATCFHLVNSANQPFLINGVTPLNVAGATHNVVLPNSFNVFALGPGASAPNVIIGANDALFNVDSTSTLNINGTKVQVQ